MIIRLILFSPMALLLVMPVGLFFVLRSWSQVLMWEASLLLASGAAFLGYFRIEENFAPPFPLFYVFWGLKILAVASPACIAFAWARWAGVTRWLCLLLFPLVPVGAFAMWVFIMFQFAN